MEKDETAVLDRVAFDDFAGLYDAGELRDTIEQWHADSTTTLAAIAEARARGDDARIGELAHRTAGGGLAIGALALATACERLRAAAESGAPVTDAQIAPLRAAVAATYGALTDAVSSSP